jgi:spore coat protein A
LRFTRRRFFLYAGALTAAPRSPSLDPNKLEKFVDPLPIPLVAKSTERRSVPGNPKLTVPYFRVGMRQIESRMHRDLLPARQWAFNGTSPGPTFETRTGQGLIVEWESQLPTRHLFEIDHNLHGAEADKPETRAVVHVHGAKVPPGSDGYPDDWYAPGNSAVYYYPNNQDAATLWYHDHAMGINRLNIYAGLFGLFLVRDSAEDALNLPKGRFEIPLIICDRLFTQDGQLDYPVSGVPGAPWVPELAGNTMVVNGKIFPYLDVDSRKYRFRILNASNSRFFHLSLSNGQDIHQIGTDQGLLPAPVSLKDFVLAPAERADVVIDFNQHAGEQIVLKSDSFDLMQFRVSPRKAADTSSLPRTLRPVPPILESSAVRTRILTIDEYRNAQGDSILMLLNRSYWHMPITENPVLNTVEIWTILNPTDDSHPIHLHLVRFQILDRRRYEPFIYQSTGQLKFTGPVEPPEPYEAGWKDTVRAHAGMVTRIIARFEGYTGRYVWHCHVLEHEDNEMMRPFEVIAGS